MNKYDQILDRLHASPAQWLITGVAGFIGSNILEHLLKNNQKVVGLDNFSTGHHRNIKQVERVVGAEKWENFSLIEGDIRDFGVCQEVCKSVDYVLHQAALGSVPRSISDPIATNANNISGFLNMLVASRDSRVKKFVYAASSSTYGDHPELPKIEDRIGKPLSPYAVTKYVNELYAQVFARVYDFESVGLRYFNVFGPRQDPNGAYAAVIPKWINAMINDDQIYINGDGETSRDFCFVDNAVQANILAATSDGVGDQVYNVAVGDRTTLNELYDFIRDGLNSQFPHVGSASAEYRAFRQGDVKHSQADISKAKAILGYEPNYKVRQGLTQAMGWYIENSLSH